MLCNYHNILFYFVYFFKVHFREKETDSGGEEEGPRERGERIPSRLHAEYGAGERAQS